jgi:hypothetical protein
MKSSSWLSYISIINVDGSKKYLPAFETSTQWRPDVFNKMTCILFDVANGLYKQTLYLRESIERWSTSIYLPPQQTWRSDGYLAIALSYDKNVTASSKLDVFTENSNEWRQISIDFVPTHDDILTVFLPTTDVFTKKVTTKWVSVATPMYDDLTLTGMTFADDGHVWLFMATKRVDQSPPSATTVITYNNCTVITKPLPAGMGSFIVFRAKVSDAGVLSDTTGDISITAKYVPYGAAMAQTPTLMVGAKGNGFVRCIFACKVEDLTFGGAACTGLSPGYDLVSLDISPDMTANNFKSISKDGNYVPTGLQLLFAHDEASGAYSLGCGNTFAAIL